MPASNSNDKPAAFSLGEEKENLAGIISPIYSGVLPFTPHLTFGEKMRERVRERERERVRERENRRERRDIAQGKKKKSSGQVS